MPRWIIGLFAVLFLAGGAAVAAWSVELPYFAFSPGPVGDAIEAVEPVEQVEMFHPRGELLMLTVSVQEVNAYELAAAIADPSVDVVRRERVRRPGETDEEFQQRTLQAMDTSVHTAVAVALDYLGIEVRSDGVEVVEAIDEFPAADVLEPGDVIHQVDGDPVRLVGDIATALEGREPGDTIEVVLERDGERRTVEVELGGSEDDPGRALIGVRVQNVNPRFPVDIEPGNIGGPSAGMMYTLAVIDLLSEGDLAKGHVIAGTGTIAADGQVGAIGGIRQKVVAAEAAGAEIILVPEANYEEAMSAPAETIEIVPVATVFEALDYLESLEPATTVAAAG